MDLDSIINFFINIFIQTFSYWGFYNFDSVFLIFIRFIGIDNLFDMNHVFITFIRYVIAPIIYFFATHLNNILIAIMTIIFAIWMIIVLFVPHIIIIPFGFIPIIIPLKFPLLQIPPFPQLTKRGILPFMRNTISRLFMSDENIYQKFSGILFDTFGFLKNDIKEMVLDYVTLNDDDNNKKYSKGLQDDEYSLSTIDDDNPNAAKQATESTNKNKSISDKIEKEKQICISANAKLSHYGMSSSQMMINNNNNPDIIPCITRGSMASLKTRI